MQRTGISRVVTISFLLSWCLATPARAVEVVSFLANGSFEKADRKAKDRPADWRAESSGKQATLEYACCGHTGKRCVLIATPPKGEAIWTQRTAIELYARYRLSGWIKTVDIEPSAGRGAMLRVRASHSTASAAVNGTSDWRRVELNFDADDRDAVHIDCVVDGNLQASGRAWFDDLMLEQISIPKPPKPSIVIDAAKIAQPISPYVYGQFIEHLGRCIYGGIWAEMLEDRKFFYAVGTKDSPWKSLGLADVVRMDSQRAFVGQHTPWITLGGGSPRGIAQEGLGLIAGKAYHGYLWLAGQGTVGPVQVSLVWGDDRQDRQTVTIREVSERYVRTPMQFTSARSTDNGRLEIVSTGTGRLAVGTVSLMPADNVHGMRADTLKLLAELDSPVYRWPGGNFVSGYDWKDGVGDRDRRPPRKNPAWKGVEHNDFGLDEFMVFCHLLKTEPYLAVNSGLGDVAMAADEVEYANGKATSAGGLRRARNGHLEPYGVRFWSVGNEMYGGWQLGHMPIEKYAQKHNDFAQAMRKVDPSIQLIGVGDAGPWSEAMLRECAGHMELISEHFYCQEKPGLWNHVRQIPNSVRRKAEAHRDYRARLESLRGKDIRIALDEWNYWYGGHEFGELGTRYFLKDGLGIAAGLHECARQSDLFFMANYAQTVNVIGCIKTSKTQAALETTGLVLKLYRKRFGTLPVATQSSPMVDAMAAWSADRQTLTIGVVNACRERLDVSLSLRGAKLAGSGTRWQIADNDPMVYNDPAYPNRVRIEESAVSGIADKLSVAPCSVTLFALQASGD